MSQSNIILNKILTDSVKMGSGYLHLEIGLKPTARVGSKLVELENEAVISNDFLNELNETILSPEEQKVLNKRKSIVIVHNFEGNIRFKIHFFYQKKSLAVLFIYIPAVIKSPEEMGLSSQFINLMNHRKGLIVVGGLHGSGKTATVASLLNFVNHTQSKYILTLEQPIEHILNSEKSIIEQREIGLDASGFLEAVQFAQESDVDIVFLSKMDNYQLLNGVINLIDSGRLVVVILEADSAPEALEKIVEIAPEAESDKIKNILADVFLGIVIQQLLPRRGGGQIITSEILIQNTAVMALIKEGKFRQAISVMQTSRDEGMQTLDQSLIELVSTGEVNFEDALPLAIDKIDFQAAAQEQNTKSN